MLGFELRYVIQSPAHLHDYRIDEFSHSFRSWSFKRGSDQAKKFLRNLRSNEAKMMGGRIRSCKLLLKIPIISRYFDISLRKYPVL